MTDEPHTDRTREVEPIRFSTAAGGDGAAAREDGAVIAEAVLALDVGAVGSYTLLCTPGDELALAAGFALTEGLIAERADIAELAPCRDDPGIIRLLLRDPDRAAATGRTLIVASSCGLCGGRAAIEGLLGGMTVVGDALRVERDRLPAAMAALRERQELFRRTGGAHAAALFAADGTVLAFAEDLGRHNALDKVIGARLLAGESPRGTAVALSGRVSFELVAKCARAGIELMSAVSAPSALALEAAERCRITVCGFVREDRATVYTHPFRIRNLEVSS